MQTSDLRVKDDIEPVDTARQLDNVKRLNLYHYKLRPEWAQQAGRAFDDVRETGILAQELQEVLPDAVRQTNQMIFTEDELIDNLLVVNKDRVYMENIGAVQELCHMTDTLDGRIRELEVSGFLWVLNWSGIRC